MGNQDAMRLKIWRLLSRELSETGIETPKADPGVSGCVPRIPRETRGRTKPPPSQDGYAADRGLTSDLGGKHRAWTALAVLHPLSTGLGVSERQITNSEMAST